MRIDVSAAALAAGFSNDPAGTHTSRTIMLGELRSLLAATRGDATYDDYVNSIVGDNALRKATSSTRQKSLRHLRELYALRSTVPAFAGLRALWSADESAQPLLAMLCSVARDPLLRSTAAVVLDAGPGTSLAAPDFAEAVGHSFPGRFTPGVLARIGRNVASSWTQSGHLRRRAGKIRASPRGCHRVVVGDGGRQERRHAGNLSPGRHPSASPPARGTRSERPPCRESPTCPSSDRLAPFHM